MDYRETAEEFYRILLGGVSSRISKFLDEGLRGLYVVLKTVRDSETEISPGDIAKNLNISTARVAVALKTLERKGYISKSHPAYDGRKVLLKSTPLGDQVLSEREKSVYDLIEALLRKLTEQEAQTYIRLTKKLFQ